MSMAAVSCRQDAVKEINAAFYRLQNIFGCPNAHQVSRLLLRQIRYNLIQNTIHSAWDPYRKTADGIAINSISEIRFACSIRISSKVAP